MSVKKQALVQSDRGLVWVDVYGERDVAEKSASTRLALLRYATQEPNRRGYTCYVAAVTDPESEAGVEARNNFVRWLGPRQEFA